MKLVNGLLEMPEDIIDEGDWCAQAKKLGQYKATGKSGKEIKKYASLVRVAARSKDMDFDRIGLATTAEKDDLQRIKGIGPFLEEKVNALGIYTFAQIGRFNKGDVQLVNDAIEFFPGRIERDEWVKQAKVLAKEAKKANK